MQCWNIGNTTVRNPFRIEEALKAVSTKVFDRAWNSSREYQKKTYDVLLEFDLISSSSKDEQESLGRKWIACFKQLGFLTVFKERNILQLTEVGNALINDVLPAEDVFLKQLMKLHLPNYLENGSRYRDFDIHPFFIFVKCLYDLRKKYGQPGLNKIEIALFVIPCINQSKSSELPEKIIKFRSAYKSRKGMVEKSKFIKEQYLAVSKDADGFVKLATLKDYADSSLRYFLRTGIFTVRGSRVEIASHKMELASFVIENSLNETQDASLSAYESIYTSISVPELPYLERSYLSGVITELKESASAEGIDVAEVDFSKDSNQLRGIQIEIEKEILIKKERKFMLMQRTQTEEIVENFDSIKNKTFLGGDMYAPAFYEWNTWRAFLAIDDFISSVSETRGFQIDADMNPTHHAKGGYADMQFEYRNNVLVVECTLSEGENQWSMEREPVQRHIKNAMRTTPKDVLGIFVAPSISINTYHSFINESLYVNPDDNAPRRINIIPLTDRQLSQLLKKYNFSDGSNDLINKLNLLLSIRDEVKNDARLWSLEIQKYLFS